MLTLRPYTAADAPVIASWVENERTLRLWGADLFSGAPLPGQELEDYYEKLSREEQVWPLMAEEGGLPVGHVLLWSMGEGYVRLCFVIVDPNRRREGVGSRLLRLALDHAYGPLGMDRVDLEVFRANGGAVGCYEKMGFRRIPRDPELTFPALGETWERWVMEHRP